MSPQALDAYGAFDISLVNDLPLFVDPFLLFNSDDPTYQGLHDEIIRYMRFLRDVSQQGTIAPRLLDAWFTFPEVKQNWFGFSQEGNCGHGLGRDFGRALYRNLTSVFRDFGAETVTASSHIEKLCLIRDGVGRDNLSDFTTNLIMGHLAEFTQSFALDNIDPAMRREIPLNKAAFNYKTRTWATRRYELPYYDGDFVLLTPKDLLTKDEAWINRPELIDRFVGIAESLPDAVLRAQVNQYLLRVLPSDPKAGPKEVGKAIGLAIERFPEVLDYYVLDKERHADQASSVAQARVLEVERRFVDQVRQLVDGYLGPLGFYEIPGDTYSEARRRALFLKDVIENKGGHRIFYVDNVPVQRESDLHILYRLTWYAPLSDVSREVNDGRGPADFKVSRGALDKTLVEFKLAKNTQLERNLANQTGIYESASDATHPSLKVIIYFSEQELLRVNAILERLGLADSPHVLLIDARADNKPSGSRA